MEERKINLVSLVGTIGFHVLIIVLLLFVYMKPTILEDRLSEGLEGVPVMFGNVPDAFGQDEPNGRGSGAVAANEPAPNEAEVAKPVESSKPEPVAKGNNNIATQDTEETIALKEANRKAAEENRRREAEETEKRRIQAEADRAAREQAEKGKAIDNQMSGLFGNGSGSGSRGETEGTGTQGVPTGNASYGKTSGVGGWGSFDLGGRSLGSGGLVKPTYSVDDYGTVVVDIIVDAKGNVVEANIGKGTNTPSTTLRAEALKAAKKTKFNAVSAVINQKGTITYKFNLN
jgi:TonB family protein